MRIYILAGIWTTLSLSPCYAGCNFPNQGFTISFEFEKAADGSAGNAYGYDVLTDGTKHVSVAMNGSTYVRLKAYQNGNNIALNSTSWNSGQFAIENSDSSIVSFSAGPYDIPLEGYLFKLDGLAIDENTGVGNAVLTITTDFEGASGTCGKINVHVYEEQLIDDWHLYYFDTIPSTRKTELESKAFVNLANTVTKPAVFSFSEADVSDITSTQTYDHNNNGSLDMYPEVSPSPSGPEHATILTFCENLEGNPKTLIVDATQLGLTLRSDAEIGATRVFVSPVALNFLGEENVTLGCQNNEESATIDSLISVGGFYVIVELRDALTNNHATGFNDGIYKGGAAQSGDIGIIGASLGDNFIVHEVMHAPVCGGLSNIEDTLDANNIMTITVPRQPSQLRYQSLEKVSGGKENQWNSVSRP